MKCCNFQVGKYTDISSMEYYDDDESQGMFPKYECRPRVAERMPTKILIFSNDSVQEANTQWTKRKRTTVTAEKGKILRELKHRER